MLWDVSVLKWEFNILEKAFGRLFVNNVLTEKEALHPVCQGVKPLLEDKQ